jgi:hypothetical protein
MLMPRLAVISVASDKGRSVMMTTRTQLFDTGHAATRPVLDAAALSDERGPTMLTEAESDLVAAAGSKPGVADLGLDLPPRKPL